VGVTEAVSQQREQCVLASRALRCRVPDGEQLLGAGVGGIPLLRRNPRPLLQLRVQARRDAAPQRAHAAGDLGEACRGHAGERAPARRWLRRAQVRREQVGVEGAIAAARRQVAQVRARPRRHLAARVNNDDAGAARREAARHHAAHEPSAEDRDVREVPVAAHASHDGRIARALAAWQRPRRAHPHPGRRRRFVPARRMPLYIGRCPAMLIETRSPPS
jgi:hypothetical protein